jgi:hypothetical protein
MQSRARRIRSATVVLLLLCIGTVLADEVVVEVQKLVIRSGKGSMYPPVAEAKVNDKLTVVERQPDDWLRVQYAGKEGFVKGAALKPRGATGLSGLAEGANKLTGNTSDVGASAAARGIDANALEYASSKNLNTAGLEAMVQSRQRVAGERWVQFVREGNLSAGK